MHVDACRLFVSILDETKLRELSCIIIHRNTYLHQELPKNRPTSSCIQLSVMQCRVVWTRKVSTNLSRPSVADCILYQSHPHSLGYSAEEYDHAWPMWSLKNQRIFQIYCTYGWIYANRTTIVIRKMEISKISIYCIYIVKYRCQVGCRLLTTVNQAMLARLFSICTWVCFFSQHLQLPTFQIWPTPGKLTCPRKSMVGTCISCWNRPFLGDIPPFSGW